MDTPNNASQLPQQAGVTDLLALRRNLPAEIKTRKPDFWKQSSKQGIIRAESTRNTELATHQPAHQIRNNILKGLGVVLGFFPPVWPFYLGGWIFWRSRPQQKSMRLTRKAIKSLEKGQAGIALKQLQEAHYLDPSNNDALYWLGMLLTRQNRQEEAIEALTLVSDRVPGLSEVETALVDACVATSKPKAAIYHAQRLLDIAPYAPETPLKLADAFEAAGNINLAIDALEKAPLHKRVLTPALTEIHYRLGLFYQQTGDFEKAMSHFKTVYAKDISYRDVQSLISQTEQH